MVLQVIVLAGGRGGNLYPLTTHIPKMLLPIANKPMIIYVLEMLERSDCRFSQPILIATQQEYQNKLAKCLESRYRPMSENSFEIVGIPEDSPGTLGALRHIYSLNYIAKGINDLLIISADLLLDFSVLPSYINDFRLAGHDCSILTHVAKVSYEEMQIFALNNHQIVQIFEWVDIEEGINLSVKTLQRFPKIRLRNDLVQNYCYLFKSNVLKNFLDDPKCERFFKLKEELIPFMLQKQRSMELNVNVFIVPENNYSKRASDLRSYIDINMECCTPLSAKDREKLKVNKQIPLILLSTPNSPRNVLSNFYRAAGETIPPEYKLISSDCVIQENFKIGEKTSISKSIIGKNARIGNKCKIVGSIIMDNAVLEDEVVINNSVICSDVSIGDKCKVLNSQMAFGSSVQSSTTLKDDIRLSIT